MRHYVSIRRGLELATIVLVIFVVYWVINSAMQPTHHSEEWVTTTKMNLLKSMSSMAVRDHEVEEDSDELLGVLKEYFELPESELRDAWGNLFLIVRENEYVELVSYGKDGKRSDDDIVVRLFE